MSRIGNAVHGSRLTPKLETFTAGGASLVNNGVNSVLIPARLSAAVFGLLLAVLVFMAAWTMFGRLPALTASALLTFEPNLIARFGSKAIYGKSQN